MLVAPATTWLLVRTSPEEVSTMPVPAAFPPWYPSTGLMSMIPGLTLAATACAWEEVADPAADVPASGIVAGATRFGEATDPERKRAATPTPRTDDTNTATRRAATPSRLVRFGGAG